MLQNHAAVVSLCVTPSPGLHPAVVRTQFPDVSINRCRVRTPIKRVGTAAWDTDWEQLLKTFWGWHQHVAASLMAFNRTVFFLWSEGDSVSGFRQSSVMWTKCVCVLGRKLLHQQHQLIGYQPRAFSQRLVKNSQPVDNTSSMVKEEISEKQSSSLTVMDCKLVDRLRCVSWCHHSGIVMKETVSFSQGWVFLMIVFFFTEVWFVHPPSQARLIHRVVTSLWEKREFLFSRMALLTWALCAGLTLKVNSLEYQEEKF